MKKIIASFVLVLLIGCGIIQKQTGLTTADILDSLRALQVAAEGCVIAATAAGATAEAALCRQAAIAIAGEIALVEAGNTNTANTVIASTTKVLSRPAIRGVMKQQMLKVPAPPPQAPAKTTGWVPSPRIVLDASGA